jgi:hypothetical protein
MNDWEEIGPVAGDRKPRRKRRGSDSVEARRNGRGSGGSGGGGGGGDGGEDGWVVVDGAQAKRRRPAAPSSSAPSADDGDDGTAGGRSLLQRLSLAQAARHPVQRAMCPAQQAGADAEALVAQAVTAGVEEAARLAAAPDPAARSRSRAAHTAAAIGSWLAQAAVWAGARGPEDDEAVRVHCNVRVPGGRHSHGKREIDVVLVSRRSLVVLEVKNWSGSLTLLPDGSWEQRRRGPRGVAGPTVNHGDVLRDTAAKAAVLAAHMGCQGGDAAASSSAAAAVGGAGRGGGKNGPRVRALLPVGFPVIHRVLLVNPRLRVDPRLLVQENAAVVPPAEWKRCARALGLGGSGATGDDDDDDDDTEHLEEGGHEDVPPCASAVAVAPPAPPPSAATLASSAVSVAASAAVSTGAAVANVAGFVFGSLFRGVGGVGGRGEGAGAGAVEEEVAGGALPVLDNAGLEAVDDVLGELPTWDELRLSGGAVLTGDFVRFAGEGGRLGFVAAEGAGSAGVRGGAALAEAPVDRVTHLRFEHARGWLWGAVAMVAAVAGATPTIRTHVTRAGNSRNTRGWLEATLGVAPTAAAAAVVVSAAGAGITVAAAAAMAAVAPKPHELKAAAEHTVGTPSIDVPVDAELWFQPAGSSSPQRFPMNEVEALTLSCR